MLPNLKKNPDGSLTLYLQKDSPGAEQGVELAAGAGRPDLRGDAALLAEAAGARRQLEARAGGARRVGRPVSEFEAGALYPGHEVEGERFAARVAEAAVELGVGVAGVVVERHDARGAGGSRECEEVVQGRVPPADAAGVLLVAVLRVVDEQIDVVGQLEGRGPLRVAREVPLRGMMPLAARHPRGARVVAPSVLTQPRSGHHNSLRGAGTMLTSRASLPTSGHAIRVALGGYGYWGPNLARCIAANGSARLAAICDAAPERSAAARADHPRVPVVADLETVLCDPGIEAVVLATPTSSHAPLVRRALDQGKHVLVEKPFAGSSAGAIAMAEASQRHDLVLMVDHTYLYSPAFEAIQRVIAERGLGPLRYYHAIRSNCFAPVCETSVLWDLAVHDLSILDALVAEPPASIQAAGLRTGSGQPELNASVTLTYPDGAIASVLVSWIAPAKARKVQLGFDRHTIVWDDLVAGSSVQLFDRGLEPVADPGKHRQPHAIVEHIPVPATEPLANAIGHFLDCIAHGTPPRSDAASGLRTVRLLEAAERSLGRRGVPASVETPGVAA